VLHGHETDHEHHLIVGVGFGPLTKNMETLKLNFDNQQAREIDKIILEGIDEKYIGKISDGYHTFDELYDHRITLFIALAQLLKRQENAIGFVPKNESFVWRSHKHSDMSSWDGWFILGIGRETGDQITYHLPLSRWNETSFAETLDCAPEWDGHTPTDVLERLKNL